MMVSPSAIEASVQQSIAGQSVDQHMLSSYQYAILSVILAQFTSKGFSDGMEGIVRLLKATPRLQEVLETHMGMRMDEMLYLSRLSPEAREGQSLIGAHMPTRGFYQVADVKSPGTSCCGFPFWWRKQPAGHGRGGLHVPHESEHAKTSSEDKPEEFDVQLEESQGNRAAPLPVQGLHDG